MSRRNAAVKRPVLPDPQFNSRLATMMVARLMQHGKKSTAQRILSDAFGLINERTGGDPLELFETAVKNATPLVEVRARRVGGATYQVPVEVRPKRANTLAIRWVVDFARSRRERTMAERLANEIMDAGNGKLHVMGNFTLHGVTKEITFPATVKVASGGLLLQSQFTVDRSEFAMDYDPKKVENKVALTIAIGK